MMESNWSPSMTVSPLEVSNALPSMLKIGEASEGRVRSTTNTDMNFVNHSTGVADCIAENIPELSRNSRENVSVPSISDCRDR